MLKITNTKVYDLYESVIASGNAMRIEPVEYTKEEFQKGLKRMKRLVHEAATTEKHCHDNALTGIRVSFDLVYPQYFSPEFQRYHWIDIVTSSSKMHRLLRMDMDMHCNEYVTRQTKEHMKFLIKQYNGILEAKDTYDSEEQFKQILYTQWMRILSNCPLGLELFMRISTNYKQLQTMYRQRHDHKLHEWHIFCDWVKTLPYAKELITLEEDGEDN